MPLFTFIDSGDPPALKKAKSHSAKNASRQKKIRDVRLHHSRQRQVIGPWADSSKHVVSHPPGRSFGCHLELDARLELVGPKHHGGCQVEEIESGSDLDDSTLAGIPFNSRSTEDGGHTIQVATPDPNPMAGAFSCFWGLFPQLDRADLQLLRWCESSTS
jgi:hypothetical protein